MSGAVSPRWLLGGTGCAVALAVAACVQHVDVDGAVAAAPSPVAARAEPSTAPMPLLAPLTAPLPASTTTPAAAPPAMPFSYVGGWSEAGRPAAVLRRDGQVFTVRAAGPLDAQYAVEAIEAERVLLRHVPSGSARWLALGAVPDPATSAPAPADTRPIGAAAAPAALTVDVDSERLGN